jgi:hypothetical protein
MAFTAITYVFNQSKHRVQVINRRNGEGTNGAVQEQQGRSMYTWVEWARDRREFNASHFIEVRLLFEPGIDVVFSLWQQDKRDGDFVRVSRNAEEPYFDDDAPPVPGNGARAGGDRVLRVIDDFTIVLDVAGAPASFVSEVTSEETVQAYFQTGSRSE